MEISSSSSLWSYAGLFSSSSTTSVMTGDSSFTDLLASVGSTSSLAQQMSEIGVEDFGHAPDFASMTTDEFLEHLIEMQETLSASGIDISSLADPSEMTTSELESLKEEMMSRGKNPSPPPSDIMDSIDMIDMFHLNMVDYSSDNLYSTLFDYL